MLALERFKFTFVRFVRDEELVFVNACEIYADSFDKFVYRRLDALSVDISSTRLLSMLRDTRYRQIFAG